MQTFATTKMSSKGQVVIPEKIRSQIGLTAGQEVLGVGGRDGVILKSVKPPTLKAVDALISRARQEARRYGLKKKDVADAIARARAHK